MRWTVVVVMLAGCGRLDFDSIDAPGMPAGSDAPACRGLDASWTPEWAKLIEYEPFDGAGAIANFAVIPAKVGANGVAGNVGDAGMKYVPGKIAQAIVFDGIDDDVSIMLPGLDTTAGDSISVALWMKWSGTLYAGNSGEWTKIVLFDGTPEYALTFVSDGGVPVMGYNTGQGDLWGIDTSGLANTWVHVVAVFDNAMSNQSLVYVNGQPQAMTQQIGSSHTSTVDANFLVAALPSYPSFFAGELDELAVWNVALAPGEVQTLYTACP